MSWARRLLLWSLPVMAAVGALFVYLGVDTAGLFSGKGIGQMVAYVSEFSPPDLSAPYLWAIDRGLLGTPAMLAINIPPAVLFGLLFTPSAAGCSGVPVQSLARLLLNALHVVPEPVWGALMVLAAGLGPDIGTFILTLHTDDVLGWLFAETLENIPAQSAEASRLVGSGRPAVLAYDVLLGVQLQPAAYTLYRWENNIRIASVFGFVGVGGLGQMPYFSLSLFQQAQAAIVILAILVLALGVDSLSAWARQHWVNQ